MELRDRIQTCSTEATDDTILEILNIMLALDEKIEMVKAEQSRSANVASCLANGIKLD